MFEHFTLTYLHEVGTQVWIVVTISPPGRHMSPKMHLIIGLLMKRFRTMRALKFCFFSTFITKVTVKMDFSFVTSTTLATIMPDF